MAEVRVIATEGGPYRVTGPIELLDPQGNPIELPGATVFLCRCGGSANKPFCDSWTPGPDAGDADPEAGDADPDGGRITCVRVS